MGVSKTSNRRCIKWYSSVTGEGWQNIQLRGKNGAENWTFCHFFQNLGKFGGKNTIKSCFVQLWGWKKKEFSSVDARSARAEKSPNSNFIHRRCHRQHFSQVAHQLPDNGRHWHFSLQAALSSCRHSGLPQIWKVFFCAANLLNSMLVVSFWSFSEILLQIFLNMKFCLSSLCFK